MFEWRVLYKGGLTDNNNMSRYFHTINWSNNYLWGSKHTTRFKHGTKVYFRKGEHEGHHGVVVGHLPFFDIKAHPDTIICIYVLLASERIVEVCQDFLKLVDLHQLLPLGIPRPYKETKKKRKKSSGWGEMEVDGVSQATTRLNEAKEMRRMVVVLLVDGVGATPRTTQVQVDGARSLTRGRVLGRIVTV